jgi:4-amino-4-deoxy-L-arabinose transferase-like glycosyltransferase
MPPAPRHASNPPLTAVRVTCVVLAAALIALMLTGFVVRVPFPFELEWMEGATLIHIQRLAHGQQLYAAPSLDFVPFTYPPLYYIVAVPFTWIAATGFTAPRLISALASLVTLAAIYTMVQRRAGSFQGAVAAGVFAGAYALSDGWFDLARVDALYVALMAFAWLRITSARTPRDWLLAAVVISLAFFTKQPAVLSVVPLIVFLLVTDRSAAAWFGGTIALLVGGGWLALHWWTDGWFTYYVMELPRLRMRVSFDAHRLLTFWSHDVLRPMAIALLLGSAGTLALRRWRDAAIASGLIATAWMARLEGGAWTNALLPAYLAIAVLFGLSLQRLGRWTLPVTAAAALQLALLLYDPRPLLPTDSDRAAGERVVEALRALPGPVLVIDHSYWSTLAALPEHAHGWAVTDVVWADRAKAGPSLEAEIRSQLQQQRFTTIVVDTGTSWFLEDVESGYTAAGALTGGEPYRPRSGAPRHPERVFVRSR